MLALLQPAANFTDWAGSATKPTLSHIYTHAYSILPPLDMLNTTQAKALHKGLEAQIKESWPLALIEDHKLLAIYLNPACVASDFMQTKVKDPAVADGLITLECRAMALLEGKILHWLTSQDCANVWRDIKFASIMETWIKLAATLGTKIYQAYYADKAHVVEYANCPQDFWISYHDDHSLGVVAAIAPSYLCIQATSSASE